MIFIYIFISKNHLKFIVTINKKQFIRLRNNTYSIINPPITPQAPKHKHMSLKDFVILQKLGSGSFASVYKARRLIDQEIYALKKIDMKALGAKEKNNALNEIRLLACLSSPYIIGYCESFFDEKLDVLTITMEYANEGDLLKKIQKHKKLRSLMPQVEVWKIFIHLLYGLNELHAKNILHRDLKAENIFIGNGVYKIGDMNVSKIIKNGLASTQTGTPYYASPQVWNDQPYNDKSDIWSLGCILYEAATLRPPYEATSMEKLFDMVNRALTPKIPTNYSRELQLIIDACLQKNPGNRPSTKQLLTNQTLKIYENLVIDFKPQIGSGMKEPLLKTIYMPSSKRQLKNQLPQSNYKTNQGKNQSKEQEQHIIKNTVQKQIEIVQPTLIGIQNLPKPSQKKEQSHRNRSRIMSCQIFKDAQFKKVSSKENLMARADFIIESQRKVTKQKDDEDGHHSAIIPKIIQKKTSVKHITTNSKPPVHNSRLQSQKYLNKQIYIEDEEIIVPKRLVFDDERDGNLTYQVQPVLINIDSIPSIKIEKVTVEQVCKQIQKISEPCIDAANNQEKNRSRQPYQYEDLKNVSIISQKNHEHYNFETDIKPISQSEIHQNYQQSNKEIPISQNFQSYASHVQRLQAFLPQPVSILIDVNENLHKIKVSKTISHQTSMSYLLALQKIKNLTQNIKFKNIICAFGIIKNYFIKQKIIQKQQSLQLKFYHQSHKAIKQNLEPSTKPNSQHTPSKTFQKRSRSKSIRKTEKFKPLISQSNTNSNLALIDKINQKISIELHKKSMEKSAKKQKASKKAIFDKENKLFQEPSETNYKQLCLIPKNIIEPLVPHGASPQKCKPLNNNNYPVSLHKPRSQALRDLQSANTITPLKGQKKHSFIGINLFEQKKKKIFETPNPVHELSNQLERVGLDKKMRKYINV